MHLISRCNIICSFCLIRYSNSLFVRFPYLIFYRSKSPPPPSPSISICLPLSLFYDFISPFALISNAVFPFDRFEPKHVYKMVAQNTLRRWAGNQAFFEHNFQIWRYFPCKQLPVQIELPNSLHAPWATFYTSTMIWTVFSENSII